MTAAPVAQWLTTRPFTWRAGAVVAGAALMALCSQAEFPIGPVPLTLQTFGLFVLAGLCGGAVALSAVLLWLAAAATGLPVLAGGAAGLPALLGYTAGFLAGMAAAAWICGRGAERTRIFWQLFALFLAGHAIVLSVGYVGLLSYMDAGNAFVSGIAPFIPGGILKSVAAAGVVWWAARR